MWYRICAALLLLVTHTTHAEETGVPQWQTSGHAGLALRFYPQNPEDNQESTGVGLRLAPEWSHPGDTRFLVAPIIRIENNDSGRSIVDFNELYISGRRGDTTLEFGITRLFWGVTESRHLENIINPPDLAAHYAGDTTLGVALLRLAEPTEFGQIEFILIPWDRDPRFPGEQGRPRTEWYIQGDVDHPDGRPAAWASRVSLDGGNYDAHAYYFQGLDREATLFPLFDILGQPESLRASRKQIQQWGADLQIPFGNVLLKAEAIHRSGYSRSFAAAVLGGEYTLNSIGNSTSDLGLLVEYQYDNDRPTDAPLAPMKRAVYAGIRGALNDPANSEFKFGLVHDTTNEARIWRGDFSRRIADDWTVECALNIFSNVRGQPPLSGFARDSYLELLIKRNF